MGVFVAEPVAVFAGVVAGHPVEEFATVGGPAGEGAGDFPGVVEVGGADD